MAATETGHRSAIVGAVARRKRAQGKQPVAELIGRSVYGDGQAAVYRTRMAPLIDRTIPDYEYWDKLRRGKLSGYTLGGLFCKRIEHIFSSWVLGAGVEITLKDVDPITGLPALNETSQYTDTAIAAFVASLLDSGQDNADEDSDTDVQGSLLAGLYEDSMGLGDQYVIVNADGTLSIPSPDTVTIKRDELDYRIILSLTVETKLPGYTILDEYRADGRTVTVKKGAQIVSVQQYQNLIGRLPAVHVANERSGNETNGHPIHEDLLPLFNEYDDVLYKQIDGAKMMGNPTPVLKGLEDVEQTKRDNSPSTPETYYDRDGNYTTRAEFQLDRNAALLLGVGADFVYAAPPVGFTKDTQQSLDTLFLMLQYRTGIPKFAWGDELTSSRATAGVQADQFIKDIQGRRNDCGGWIVRLVKIWLQFKALTDPQIVVGNLALRWPELQTEDETVQLAKIKYARDAGLLTDETALKLLDLVDDPAEESAKAAVELEARQAALMLDAAPAGDNPVAQMNDDDDSPAQMPDTSYYIIDAVRELRTSLLEAK
jgi:hypothetical protein